MYIKYLWHKLTKPAIREYISYNDYKIIMALIKGIKEVERRFCKYLKTGRIKRYDKYADRIAELETKIIDLYGVDRKLDSEHG